MSLHGIIFDHDGTLVDSEGVHFSIWQEILAGMSVGFTKEAYLLHYCGVPTRKNAEDLVAQHNLPITADELYRTKQQRLEQRLAATPFPAMPGARDAMVQCRQAGLKVGIATGANRFELDTSIAAHNFGDFVQAATTRDDVTRSKPAPDTYLRTLEQLQLPATEAIAVEDSTTGIAAAKAAGMRCIAVAYEFAKGQDLSAADYHVDDLSAAAALAISLQ
ncbi:HAD family hydrolase [Teredinibacter turnerae]|uniref:HAD family hydrolase n=1 Tax=Teredinibacter turnerae TaxID=2426 RepID=UPI0003801BC4|nr:HAD family phosphatase [Teredinibacter turnerae]